MQLTRHYWLALVPVIAIATFFAGRELRPDPVASFNYERDAPGYEAAVPDAGLSKGGFSGFGGDASLDGQTVVAGRVTAVGADSVTVETESGESVPVRVTASGPLHRIDPASLATLRPGMTVAVRTGATPEEAAGVLVLATP